MKKLTYLFLIIGIMNSCGAYPDKNSVMTIEEIGITESKNSGKYRYSINVPNSINDIILWSDSLYSIGDTLKLVKQ